MKTSTAIYRNLIRTPKILSFILFIEVNALDGFCIGFILKPSALAILAIVAITGINWWLSIELGKFLVKERTIMWAAEYHGIAEEDAYDWINELDAHELEEMIAFDFEGFGSFKSSSDTQSE